MDKIWQDAAWADYLYWQTQDKKTLKKINRLLQSIDRSDDDCQGQPEPLKGDLSGFWSVRIDAKNRIVFGLRITAWRLHNVVRTIGTNEKRRSFHEFSRISFRGGCFYCLYTADIQPRKRPLTFYCIITDIERTGGIFLAVTKLELTWVGKDEPMQKIEPRLLLHHKEKSYGETGTGNMLIHGDNLLALRALLPKYGGQVKCVYADIPYNTGSAFSQYDDNLEHSTWLNLIRPRMEILYQLLSGDGSLWVSIDDDEQAYVKVLLDEIFLRKNFIASIVWQKRTSPDMRSVISDGHDYVLVYAKDKDAFKASRNYLPLSPEQASSYKNPDNDPRGPWRSIDLTGQVGHATASQFYEIELPDGRKLPPPDGRCWALSEETFHSLLKDNRIWLGTDGTSRPRQKKFLSEAKGVVPWTWWTNKEVGHNQEAKKEVIALFGPEKPFDTPKPERLIQRVMQIASNEGDLVLDAFLGSGTTAAVAHKMNRRYIGIEMGDHCYTHCKVRLDKVVDGEQGGISKAQSWTGGGGYDFYELAPTLLKEDAIGELVINKEYDADKLAAAVALHEGYTYCPDQKMFWKQSQGTEHSFLYVTTQHITAAYLAGIQQVMAENEFLIVACKSFDEDADKGTPQIRVKKIPQMLLGSCAFGHEDYALNIVRPPQYVDEESEVEDDEC